MDALETICKAVVNVLEQAGQAASYGDAVNGARQIYTSADNGCWVKLEDNELIAVFHFDGPEPGDIREARFDAIAEPAYENIAAQLAWLINS